MNYEGYGTLCLLGKGALVIPCVDNLTEVKSYMFNIYRMALPPSY